MIPRNQYTVMDDNQWANLDKLTDAVIPLTGEVAEIGVYRGGSALLLCEKFSQQTVYLIDTFNGIPGLCTDLDLHKPNDFTCSLEQVKKVVLINAKLIQGTYSKSFDPLRGLRLKFLHVDVDIETSVEDAVRLNFSRMVSGGIILVDDYNAIACRGAQRALNRFCISHGIEIHTTINTPQAWIVK